MSARGDLLLVEDVQLVRQLCNPVNVKFDDSSVADFFDSQVDQGRSPEEFARLWIHTHPGDSPYPSSTDEQTFSRCFGAADWSIMFILARGGQTYARLRFGTGPGMEVRLAVEIDFTGPFPATDLAGWEAEYRQNVKFDEPPLRPGPTAEPQAAKQANAQRMDWPAERDLFLDDPFFDPHVPDPFLELAYERF